MIALSNTPAYSRLPFKIRQDRSGTHLFNRRSGWNILFDEISPPPEKWATAPRQVSIALTNACDLKCSYCFAPKARSALDFNQTVRWVHELDANGTLGVGFGGGEPTLYPRFAELCAHVAEHTALAVTFTTHGHHLDDYLLRRLEGHVDFIRFSMDGVGETYERLRHRPYAHLLQRMMSARQMTRFGINFVVNFDTFPDLNRAIELAEKLSASEFLLLPERPVNARVGITEDVMQRLRQWIDHYDGRTPLSISESSSDGLPLADGFSSDPAINKYAHVDAHGTLKLTSFHKTGIAIQNGIMTAVSELRSQTVAK